MLLRHCSEGGISMARVAYSMGCQLGIAGTHPTYLLPRPFKWPTPCGTLIPH